MTTYHINVCYRVQSEQQFRVELPLQRAQPSGRCANTASSNHWRWVQHELTIWNIQTVKSIHNLMFTSTIWNIQTVKSIHNLICLHQQSETFKYWNQYTICYVYSNNLKHSNIEINTQYDIITNCPRHNFKSIISAINDIAWNIMLSTLCFTNIIQRI